MTTSGPELEPASSLPERRLVTALVCGFTAADPARPCEMSAGLRRTAIAVIEAAGGIVAAGPADQAIEGWFGLVRAEETDAERAVMAGLELIAAGAGDGRTEIRIGVATGKVLASGRGAPREGEPAALARQLHALARSGEMVIAESTRALTGGLFAYQEREAVTGVAGPVRSFRVLGPTGNDSRFEALRSQRVPFLGRHAEMALLQGLWAEVENGCGHAVLLSGAPGIGKSRLADEFDRQLGSVPHKRLRLFCSPHHRNSALHPFLVQLRRAASIAGTDAAQAKREKLHALLGEAGVQSRETIEVFSDVLGIPLAADAEKAVSRRRTRQVLLAGLLGLFESLARQGPVLGIVEDAQWIDPTSADLLDRMVRRAADVPALLLVTGRPEYQPAWRSAAHAAVTALGSLDQADVARLIARLCGHLEMPPELLRQVVDRTDGVPLFVEELTKVLIEIGVPRRPDGGFCPVAGFGLAHLPLSVQASVQSRIDRLGPGARALVQIGAAVGRQFSHVLLTRLAGMSGKTLDAELDQLIDANLLVPRRAPPETEYRFGHALVQETAYASIPAEVGRALHGRIARELAANTVGFEVEPEILAYHHTKAGAWEAAAAGWLEAGRRAAARSANLEAVEHLRQGLGVLAKLRLSPERDRRELALLMELGPAHMAVEGYGAPENLRIFGRARELLGDCASPQEKLHVMCGLWNVHYGRSELAAAWAVAEPCLSLARASGHGLALANCMVGQTLTSMGEFESARLYLEAVVDHFRDTAQPAGDVRFAADEHVLALAYLARVLWALGYPEQATRSVQESVAHARRSRDAVTIAIALVAHMFLAAHGAPLEEAWQRAEEATAHCTSYGLTMFEHWTRFNRGVLLARRGQVGQGIELMQEAIAGADRRHSRQFRAFQVGCLGAAHAEAGSFSVALPLFEEALATVEQTGERQSLAALHRLHGMALIKARRPDRGEEELRRAVAVARAQKSRIEELRAAHALAIHARNDDVKAESTALLARIYHGFTEGFDVPDLVNAARLLDSSADRPSI